MRAVDIIEKKRDGGELTRGELEYFIRGFIRGEVKDYQASAWAMAVYFQGMTPQETTDLTEVMAESGDQIDLSSVVPFAVDKHSTGGVGDKTTFVVQSAVVACGVPVAKMSGRGLAHTGGTLDKIESIEGYRIELTIEEFMQQLASIGQVLCGQTADLAPADKQLYALRDVTGTVPSKYLIASSVMSKKIAGGAQGMVLDVKTGLGAFMQSVDEARQLAALMVEIGQRAGRRVICLISDMNQPLGNAVGNALEVREAIHAMHGGGPVNLREHCIEVAGHMLVLASAAANLEDGKQKIAQTLDDGSALAHFRQLVEAQGGDCSMVDDPDKLPRAEFIETVGAPRHGFVEVIHALKVGGTVMALGGGREKKGDPIDHAVGVEILRNVGDKVERGDPLFTIHANKREDVVTASKQLLSAHTIVDRELEPLPLFYDTLGV
ncbi:MAG: thymidine phosphorylase [Anaerolineales bacterium]|jgi:pyrimidine-nucleoside phosphorylase